jgi:hypothetical protein
MSHNSNYCTDNSDYGPNCDYVYRATRNASELNTSSRATLDSHYANFSQCNLFSNNSQKINSGFFSQTTIESGHIVKSIEEMFACLIGSLNQAADSCIPVVKSDFFKYWWNQELDELKAKSCSTHHEWIMAGRPMHGPVYDAKRRAKTLYKSCIKNNQKIEQQSVSNDLHDALINKSSCSFWKSWNSKFGKNKIMSNSVEGFSSDQSIANNFALYFSDASNLNPSSCNDLLTAEFEKRLCSYSVHDNDIKIDIELVDGIVRNLKKGKATGADRLSSEHFQFCHPLVISILSMLFNLMVKFEFVPDFFGVGIIIPIPKKDSKSNFNKFSDFRGITVSSIISKIFELCIVENIKDLLSTSDAQFGFTPGIGCNHTIILLV